jgi:large subunit ribosomal protein L25
MSEVELHVKIREKKGKQVSKTLRSQGEIPAVYYAHDQKTVSLSVNAHTLSRLLQQEVNILNIVFPDGKTKKSIIRDLQKDPVTDQLLHIDFLGIKLDEKITMTIPIILTGTPIGVRLEGGILEHPLREVEVEGFPLDIPEHVEVDVSEMNLGDVMTLEGLKHDKYEFITDVGHPIAIVVQPKAAKAAVEEVLEEEEEETEEAEPSEEKESE